MEQINNNCFAQDELNKEVFEMKKILFYISIVIIFGASVYTVASFNKKTQANENINSKTSAASTANQASTPSNSESSTIAQIQAANFKLKDLSGKDVSLSDFTGKKVFLNFFATWCPPCRGEMPDIQQIYEETKDKDIVILAIDLGEDVKTVQSFADKNKYSFNILLDSDTAIATKYEIASIPTSYFIDRKGNITAKHIGAMSLEDMRKFINNIK